MTTLLSPDENAPEEWKRFTASMEDLSMRLPMESSDPAQNGEQELQNVLKSAVDYMKGRKSLRRDPEEQERFDQALDVVCELAKATPYAKAAAQATLDRINEVRRRHDRDHRDLRLDDFGADNLERRKALEGPNVDHRPAVQMNL